MDRGEPRVHSGRGSRALSARVPMSRRGWRPQWIERCISCEASFDVVTYRRFGLCKTCNRTETSAGRAPLRRLEFLSIKRGGTKADALAVMVLDIARSVGVPDGALMVGTIPFVFRSWVDGSIPVPMTHAEKVSGAWIAMQAGEGWRVYE